MPAGTQSIASRSKGPPHSHQSFYLSRTQVLQQHQFGALSPTSLASFRNTRLFSVCWRDVSKTPVHKIQDPSLLKLQKVRILEA